MNILENWTSNPTEHRESFVIPDGCQDIIFVQKPDERPFVYLSPLYTETIKVELETNTFMMGFRLQPGCKVMGMDSAGLLSSIHSVGALTDKIEDTTCTDSRVAEALACIRHNGQTIGYCAKQLGVSTRTLQRLLSTQTTATPSYWLRLARARQCATELVNNGLHNDIAYQYHYADQAHMCREIKHWFGVTPSQLLKRDDLTEQLFWPAY